MKKISSILLFVVLAIGCTNTNTKQKEDEKAPSELEKFKSTIADARPEINDIYNVAIYLEMSGANYMPNLVNNPQNVHNYKETPYLAAANLGIYNMDIVYQSAYRETKGAMLSYGAAKELSFEIGLDEIYDELFLKRLEEGLSEKDSLVHKMNMAISKSKNALTEKEQAALFTALTIGANVEESYILNHIIFNYNVDVPDEAKLLLLRQTILILEEQIRELIALTALFENYAPNTERGIEVLELMKKIISIYSDINFSENIQALEPKDVFENEKLLSAFENIKKLRSIIILE